MLQDSYRSETVTANREPGESYLKRNFDACRAINILKLGIVLDDMVEAGMPKEQAECFKQAAYALLQLLRTENNRLHSAALAGAAPGMEPPLSGGMKTQPTGEGEA